MQIFLIPYFWIIHLASFTTVLHSLFRAASHLKDLYVFLFFFFKTLKDLGKRQQTFLPELLLWCDEAGMEDVGESWAGKFFDLKNYLI